MSTKQTIVFIIVLTVVLILILGISIYIHLHNKFVKYMYDNYSVFREIELVDSKYQKKIKRFNPTIELKRQYLNSKRQFDNHRFQISNYEIEKYNSYFKENRTYAEENIRNFELYKNEKKTIFYNFIKNNIFEDNEYKSKKKSSFFNSFKNKKESDHMEYNNRKLYRRDGELTYVYSYTSPKGRNSYKGRASLSSNQISSLYYTNITKPREAEQIRLNKLQNRLYHNKIYMFKDSFHLEGMLCIGQTTRENVEQRIKQEYKMMPIKPYKIKHWEMAQFKHSEKWFTDKQFHRYLEKHGYKQEVTSNGKKTEWFTIDIETAKRMLEQFINSN